MADNKEPDVDINELGDFDSDDDLKEDNTVGKSDSKAEGSHARDHSAVHTSGFRDFLLKPELLRAIADCGFEHPSEVQSECIPQAIIGTDVICQANSGMGKTAVFVLAVLQQIEPVAGQVGAVILCHTRELAFQISNEFTRFKKFMKDVKVGVFYGGVPVKQNKEALKAEVPNIVIGTPGRLVQLQNEKDLNLKFVKFFVIDECDKVLSSIEMRRDVQLLFKNTPYDKQVMMFTATLPEEMKKLCKKFMHNPLEIYINLGAKLTLHGLQQYYVQLKENEKNRKLVDLLDLLEFNQLVVFVKSVNRAAELNKLLVDCNFPSICIHAGMKQDERISQYKKFKEFQGRILVTTNMMGRGVDIERVNVVINYDMSESADTYLHRVGRAGRFGTKGLAISFISSDDDNKVLSDIQQRFAVNIPLLPNEIDSSTYMNA